MLADYDSLRQLPVAEKLALIDFLWQEIESAPASETVAAENAEEMRRRAADIAANPASTLSREEVWRRVDARRG